MSQQASFPKNYKKELEEEVSVEILKQKCEEFKRIERGDAFYDMAMQIVDKFPLQACIIILATWNIRRFRFVVKSRQNLIKLKNAIDKCKPLFEKIKYENFQNVNFDSIKDTVAEIYSTLSKIKGVEYTGASKIMHLFNPNLFVMWDSYIRNYYRFKGDAQSYINFQKRMQKKFGTIKWNETGKTLAKAIDEYNYITITFSRLEKQRKKRHSKVKGLK
jgi:hypothetical protein